VNGLRTFDYPVIAETTFSALVTRTPSFFSANAIGASAVLKQ